MLAALRRRAAARHRRPARQCAPAESQLVPLRRGSPRNRRVRIPAPGPKRPDAEARPRRPAAAGDRGRGRDLHARARHRAGHGRRPDLGRGARRRLRDRHRDLRRLAVRHLAAAAGSACARRRPAEPSLDRGRVPLRLPEEGAARDLRGRHERDDLRMPRALFPALAEKLGGGAGTLGLLYAGPRSGRCSPRSPPAG